MTLPDAPDDRAFKALNTQTPHTVAGVI